MKRLMTRLLLAALAAGAGAAVLRGPEPLIIAGGLLLALLLPGLALTDLLMRRTVSATERAVLGPALSLALIIVGGLAVYVAGADLNRTTWTALTVGTTIGATLIAALRGEKTQAAVVEPAAAVTTAGLPVTVGASTSTSEGTGGIVRPGMTITLDEPSSGAPAVQPTLRPLTFLVRALPLLLAGAVLGGAAWLSLDSSRRSTEATVTALSAVQSGPVTTTGTRPVRVTVTGLTGERAPWSIVINSSDGKELQRRVLAERSGDWSATLLVTATDRISVNLFRSGDAAPYRITLLGQAA